MIWLCQDSWAPSWPYLDRCTCRVRARGLAPHKTAPQRTGSLRRTRRHRCVLELREPRERSSGCKSLSSGRASEHDMRAVFLFALLYVRPSMSACAAGSFLSNSGCAPCAAGTTNDGGATVCAAVTASTGGFTTDECGLYTSCESCIAGYTSHIGGYACAWAPSQSMKCQTLLAPLS